jgi:hypothetical protein
VKLNGNGCSFKASEIFSVRLKFAVSKDFKKKYKSYRHFQTGKVVKYVANVHTFKVADTFVQLYPPGSTKSEAYMPDQGSTKGKTATFSLYNEKQKKELTVFPDWRLGQLGKFDGDTFTVALTVADRFGLGKIEAFDMWSVEAKVTVETTPNCAKKAEKTMPAMNSKIWKDHNLLAKLPHNACIPNPCGHGTCALNVNDEKKVQCTCAKGWDKSKRLHQGADVAQLPCDHNGAAIKCPRNTKIVVTECALKKAIGTGCASCAQKCTKEQSFRLVGPKSYYGRTLEVCKDGLWGKICGLGARMAEIACRKLGIKGTSIKSTNYGTEPDKKQGYFAYKYLKCKGTETSFKQCGGQDQCNDSEWWKSRCGRCSVESVAQLSCNKAGRKSYRL